MLARLFAVAVLLAVPLAAAAPPTSPEVLPSNLDRYVYAEFTLSQPNLTALALGGDIYVYRYDVRGKVYDADELGQAYTLSNKYQGEPSGNAFVAEMENSVRTQLTSILSSSFPGSTVSGVTATVERATLRPASGNPFDPPVHVAISANVERTRSAVGLGNFTDAAVGAAFAAGARVTADFTVKADLGYRIVYTIQAPSTPAGVRFEAGPSVSVDGRTLTADVDNTIGGNPQKSVGARLYSPTAVAPVAEDIRSSIDVQMGEIEKGADGIPMELDITAEVGALDVQKRFPGLLPSKVSLNFINADGLRGLRGAGALTDATLASANDALLATIREDAARAFGPGATVSGGILVSDLAATPGSPYDAQPPLSFEATARTIYTIEGADMDDVDLALRIGGTANAELTLFASNGKATTYSIHPPSIAEFSSAAGGSVTEDGRTATFEVPAGATTFPARLSLRGRDVPQFDAEDATVDVTVDLKDLDVTLGGAMSGDFGNLLMDLTVDANLGVIEVPEQLKGSLPPNLDLKYLSADAIRLLADHGYLTEENITALEQELLDQVSGKLGSALGGTIPVEGGLDRASLAVDLVSVPISGDKPVTFKASARVSKPLAGGEVQPQAAIALYTQQLPLSLPKLEGLDTSYTVILPRGLAVTDLTGSGATYETGKSDDGRDQFVVHPTSESAAMTVSMAVTPGFVMIKFWPVVLIAVVLLLLIVGTPIALVMRKRAKGRKQQK